VDTPDRGKYCVSLSGISRRYTGDYSLTVTSIPGRRVLLSAGVQRTRKKDVDRCFAAVDSENRAFSRRCCRLSTVTIRTLSSLLKDGNRPGERTLKRFSGCWQEMEKTIVHPLVRIRIPESGAGGQKKSARVGF